MYLRFAQQLWWHACFQAGTLQFEVKPGEVVYLGEFNPEPSFDAVQKHATANRDFSASSGNRHFYFDDIPPPAILLPQDKEQGVAEVQSFVKTRMPNVSGTVRLAEYQPTRSGVGNVVVWSACLWRIFQEAAERLIANAPPIRVALQVAHAAL